jgi:uncharacterized protein YjbI with pentapeptide repeats
MWWWGPWRIARRRMHKLAIIARGRPTRVTGWILAAVLGLAAAAAYGVVLWRAPGWMHATTAQDAYNARVLVVSVGGAIVVGIGLLYTARNYRLSRRGQVTDRFTVALERLGSSELYVRIGGVHALEHVMRDSPGHHDDVIEVLTEFIRRRAPRRGRQADRQVWMHPVTGSVPDLPPEPTPDVRAALTALAHRPHRTERQRIDLTGLHLAGARLVRADLPGARLRGADLTGADLTGAYLTAADLTEATLAGADLDYASLDGASLDRADLTKATLGVADLSEARLTGAYLTAANFTAANLTGADLSGADLTGAYLTGANFTAANFTAANLFGADLYRANLAEAILTRASLGRANLRSADLTEATLTRADLIGADLTGARLRGADLTGAELSGARLRGADLTGAHLTDPAVVIAMHLIGADLTGAVWPSGASVPKGWQRGNGGHLTRNPGDLPGSEATTQQSTGS